MLFIDATCRSDHVHVRLLAGWSVCCRARESCEIPFVGAAVIKFFFLLSLSLSVFFFFFFFFFSFFFLSFSPASIEQTSRMAGGETGTKNTDDAVFNIDLTSI